MFRCGPHIDPPLALVPPILTEYGWNTFQTTLRNPRRLAKDGVPDEEDQEQFREGAAGIEELWGIAHASMLTSLGSPDPKIRNGSAGALASDANLGSALGLSGVCFHVGYQKGHDTREAALDAVVYKLNDVVSKLKPGARVLLENGCEGTELGQTVAEVGYVVRALAAPVEKVGVILDTCHLHVSGFDLSAPGAPDRLADEIEAADLWLYLTGLHLNDAQAPCGSHRDRHAAPGAGTIGAGLIRLLEHPRFGALPGVLELGINDVAKGIAFLNGSFG